MADLPYCPIYFRDLLTDCLDLTGDEFGAYVRLLGMMWLSPTCSLPDAPAKLARAAQCPPQRFRARVWPAIADRFMPATPDQPEGHITQKRLLREWFKVRATSKSQSDRRIGKGSKTDSVLAKTDDTKAPDQITPKPLKNNEVGVTGENPGNNLTKGKGIDKKEDNLFPPSYTEPYDSHSADRHEADAAPPAPPKLTPERMVEIWNAERVDPCPAVAKLSDKRRKHCRARIADTFRDPATFTAAVRRMMASSFMRGRTGWVGNFDWLVASEDNPLKLREGKYDDKALGKASGEKPSPTYQGGIVLD